ncbi:MAG: UDP-N-acetylmuramoyl-tripeptide--D-alanyl-D-alanine ligase [Agarilytica sp.]
MMLTQLEQNNIGRLHGDDVHFESLSTDTRTIKPGQLFVALRGDSFDAHSLLDEAHEKQACALVVEQKCDINLPQLIVNDTTLALGEIAAQFRKGFSGRIVAVTGSSGKTTVKGMLHAVLSKVGRCMATQGNYNNHIGVPLTLGRLNDDYDYAVVEAGMSNPGEINYLVSLILPDVAVVTNVQEAHIGQFESLADVALEKTQLYRSANVPIAVVNLDDAEVVKRLPEFSSNTIVGFSKKEKPAAISLSGYVWAKNISIDRLGCASFIMQSGSTGVGVHLNVPGEHNVDNALAVAAVSVALDVPLEKVKFGLEAFSGVSGRMQILSGLNNSTVVNDTYNANPGSLKAAIDYLSHFEGSTLVCGDMAELGEQSQKLHHDIGTYAKEKNIGRVLTVGKCSKAMSDAAKVGQHYETKDALVDEVTKNLGEQSVVLVKGSRSAAMESVVEALTQEGNG